MEASSTTHAVKGLVLTAVLVTAATGVAVGVASAQTPTGSEGSKVILRMGTMSDLNSDNPFKSCCVTDYEFLFLNYDMLLQFGRENLQATPGLATECTPSEDHLTWTCDIREGVTWSDGQPLTARDIAFTFRFILDNGSAGAFYRNYLPYNPTFETPDDQTLIWKSAQPTFAPILPPWVFILPEHVWSQYDGMDPKEIKSVSNVPSVGSGPFQLTEWNPGQGFRMVANPNYWGGTPAIDEVEFRVFDNQESMVQALKAGEVDFVDGLKPTLYDSLQGAENVTTYEAVSDWWPSFAFNFGGQGSNATNLPALHDPRVRQAIAMAIDKQRIVDSVYRGHAATGDTIVRPASAFWHLDIPQQDEYAFDPEAAQTILEEAGYVDRDGDGVREDPETGEPLELDVPVVTSTLGAVDASKLIEPWLEDVGFAVRLEPMSEARVTELWGNGDFDAFIWYWSGDPDPDFIASVYTTDQCLSWSDGCYSDPTYDQMYEAQRQIFDVAERKQAIDEIQRYIYDEVPVVVLAYPNRLQAYRNDRFTGWLAGPARDGPLAFGYGNWSYLNLEPVAGAETSTAGGGGTPIAVWIGLGVLVVVAAFALTRGRRRERREEV